MIEQLPHKFKLYRKDKYVGRETHRLCTEKNRAFTGLIDIIQSEDGYNWFSVYFEKCCIPHDEKRQLTGYFDIHGKDIAFGDKLIFPDYPETIHVVGFVYTSFDHGWLTLGAKIKVGSQAFSEHFRYMELVED